MFVQRGRETTRKGSEQHDSERMRASRVSWWSRLALAFVALGLSFALPAAESAAQTYPRCISGCDAKDVRVASVYLGGVASCVGGNQTADLYVRLEGNRTYYCVMLVVDVWVNGLLVQQNLTSTVTADWNGGATDFLVGTITWPCNQSVEIRNIYVQWSANTGCTTGDCVPYNAPSKCIGNYPNVIVYAPLNANFTGTPTNGCAPLTVQFTDLTTGGQDTLAYTYAWDFDGNGTIDSTLRNPQHIYTQAGSYTVTLTVTDARGTVDAETKTSYVTAVDCGADLRVTKTADSGTVIAGNNLTYTVIVTNDGPNMATGVTVTDTLPAGVSFVSYTTNQGTYSSGVWAVGTLSNLGSAMLTLIVNVGPGTTGTLTNTACASGSQTDPNSPTTAARRPPR